MHKFYYPHMKKNIAATLFCIVVSIGLLTTPAQAQFGPLCPPSAGTDATDNTPPGGTPFYCFRSLDVKQWWLDQDFTENQKMFLEKTFYDGYIIGDLWNKNVLPALQQMGTQISAQKEMINTLQATLKDAEELIKTQLEKDKLAVQAQEDFTPSEDVAKYPTLALSLAASELKADTTKKVLSKLMEDRTLMSGNPAPNDELIRLRTFMQDYCDLGDNNGNMKSICYPNTTKPTSKVENYNSDIDFTRVIDSRLSLDIGFIGTDLAKVTQDKKDVIALGNNLYGTEVLPKFPMKLSLEKRESESKYLNYLDYRQIAALRSVATNTYISQVAARTKGTEGSAVFMLNMMKKLGMSSTDSEKYLSANPSYYGQMEVLTKKLYQDPSFYTGLVEKPANVKRQIVAMKSIELMQNRDLFESLQRQEMLISLLLELEIRKQQRSIESTGQ